MRPLAAALGSGSGGVRVVRTGDDDVLGVEKGEMCGRTMRECTWLRKLTKIQF